MSPAVQPVRVSPRVIRLFGSWAVPIVMLAAYVFLIYTIDASITVGSITLAVFLIVIVVWFMFRELAAHAAISRAIAIGEADDVIARARNAIDHRLTTRAKLPFRVYEAVGVGLRGQWAESVAMLDALEPVAARLSVTTRQLAAAARVAAATELADPAAARAAFAALRALARPGDVALREAEARVAFVEGDRARARTLFAGLGQEIRLGPAQRGAALYYAGRCEDDPAAARTLFERARGLAPRTWVAAAVADAGPRQR